MFWAFDRDLTATQQENINPANVATLIWQHLLITAAVTAIVVLVGVPLGVLVTRPGAKALRPFVIGIANVGQAAPAIGLLVLLFLVTARTGFWIGVLPIALGAALASWAMPAVSRRTAMTTASPISVRSGCSSRACTPTT